MKGHFTKRISFLNIYLKGHLQTASDCRKMPPIYRKLHSSKGTIAISLAKYSVFCTQIACFLPMEYMFAQKLRLWPTRKSLPWEDSLALLISWAKTGQDNKCLDLFGTKTTIIKVHLLIIFFCFNNFKISNKLF